ncbi:MAG: hypothetical protein HZC55_00415 [Verrucomicrobia bacterium]|nr:hypothetical protein [Verrucomicrobiota bacterium]
MKTVEHAEIINHEGTTCPLPTVEIANGIMYPFAFDAVRPKERSWVYRLCASREPAALTNVALLELLRIHRKLRAEWEEQVGHAVGWVTIYVPRPAANGGGAQGHRAQFEKGRDLPLVKEVEPQLRERTPPSRGMDREF